MLEYQVSKYSALLQKSCRNSKVIKLMASNVMFIQPWTYCVNQNAPSLSLTGKGIKGVSWLAEKAKHWHAIRLGEWPRHIFLQRYEALWEIPAARLHTLDMSEVKRSGWLHSCLVSQCRFTPVWQCVHWPIAADWMDLTHYTLLLFQSLSEPEYMTARPAEDLSTAGNKCPPESCPAQTPGRRCLSLWPAFHPSLLLVTCASMPVIESLTRLFSHYVPFSLTSHPRRYIKICSLKES